ncbi:endonuclease/exonuclease/phosphatase family protein [Pseudonocardia sp. HH130629-09]|uniref:endonuclease/exonuclease/phosphatase family protein n=1 Tax=Pseudonocardia sp. HH130629-09 TaxID=1641402 RepID=UPI0006CB780E|nr:endonuclease/exonuclease/phosphatase family protein [Pseudonocardia sp. HH130629-09]ALE85825.1 hypothetical protein XF36_24015 [Pseudonocardia sp. HH130629-09]
MPDLRSAPVRSRRWRAAVVAGVLPVLAACASGAAREPAPLEPPTVTVIQMNLCNSGIAGCWTGQAVAAAAEVLRREVPDAVTLNEVCRADVAELERVLAGSTPGAASSSSFQPARDRDTGSPYRCANGDEYGIGVVSRAPSTVASAGIHPVQDPRDPEERAWLCLDTATAGGPVGVCTSHLAYTDRAVTRAQCAHLFGIVVAGLRARDDAGPVVVGADLNLGSAGDPDLAACVPEGSVPAADDGVQHVVVTPAASAADARVIDLRRTTDHPALLVVLRP